MSPKCKLATCENSTRADPRRKRIALDVLIIKILWLANLVYFGISSIGVSGEGALFYALFYGIIAFPLSLLAFSISPFVTGLVQFATSIVRKAGPYAATEDIVMFSLVVLLGYFQWFVLVPCLAEAFRQYIEDALEKSLKMGTILSNSINWLRIVTRWAGSGCLIVMAVFGSSHLLSIFFVQGALVTYLVFRPRKCR